jgi:hypothetical protein
MTAGDASQVKKARERVTHLERLLAKYGSASTRATPEALEEARKVLGWHEGRAAHVVADRIAPTPNPPDSYASNPLTWLRRPVLLGEHSRTRVVGFDTAIGPPEWLRDHLAAKAAATPNL